MGVESGDGGARDTQAVSLRKGEKKEITVGGGKKNKKQKKRNRRQRMLMR